VDSFPDFAIAAREAERSDAEMRLPRTKLFCLYHHPLPGRSLISIDARINEAVSCVGNIHRDAAEIGFEVRVLSIPKALTMHRIEEMRRLRRKIAMLTAMTRRRENA